MGETFIQIIEEYGPYKFMGLVSDNAANMKSAWNYVQDKYPHISVYGCLAHGLNLLLNDILKISEFKHIIEESKDVIKVIKNSYILKAILLEKQGKDKISLKLPVVTRWLSTENSLISLIKNEQYLKELAIDPRSTAYFDKSTKSIILKDSFWKRVNGIRDILFPVYVAIKFVESDKPNITKSFEIFYNLRSGVIGIKRQSLARTQI